MVTKTHGTTAGVAAWLDPGEDGSQLSPIDSPSYLLGRLWTFLSRRFNRDLSTRLGINAPEFKLLTLLHYRGPLSHRGLVEGSNMDKAQVSRTVTRLLDGGLIELAGKSGTSRRFSSATLARLTPAGERLSDDAMEIGRQHQLTLLAPLTARERAVFHDVLHRLIADEEDRAEVSQAGESPAPGKQPIPD